MMLIIVGIVLLNQDHDIHQDHDGCRWYHGSLSRSEATRLLQKEKEGGVFLVRDSTTIKVMILIYDDCDSEWTRMVESLMCLAAS